MNSTPEGAAAAAVNRQIRDAQREDDEKIKLLLLGAGESGKSTIMKQMKVGLRNFPPPLSPSPLPARVCSLAPHTSYFTLTPTPTCRLLHRCAQNMYGAPMTAQETERTSLFVQQNVLTFMKVICEALTDPDLFPDVSVLALGPSALCSPLAARHRPVCSTASEHKLILCCPQCGLVL